MVYFNIKEKSDLVNIRNKLQKRFLNEKLGEQDVYQENIKLLQPLIEPIKDITTHQKEILQNQSTMPAISMSRTPLAIEDTPASPSTRGYSSLMLGKISEKYLKTPNLDYDNAYGIKPIEGSVDFKIGKETVKIDGNNLIIDGKQYIGTKGLWKLLTLKNPGNVSTIDNDNYKKIMLQTKAFLKDDGNIKSNRGKKYETFIKPIYNEFKMFDELKKKTSELREMVRTPRRSSVGGIPQKQGTGFKFLSSDPNKLVNRHRILFSEIQSGNTNVFNELQAINDELLRLGIFDKDLIKSLNFFFSL